jgi:hypothetical protein
MLGLEDARYLSVQVKFPTAAETATTPQIDEYEMRYQKA